MRKSVVFLVVTLAAGGCVPPDEAARKATEAEATTAEAAKKAAAEKAPPTLSEVFESPNPLDAKDQPVAVKAKAAAGRVQELLANLDARIERMKAGAARPAGARSDAVEAARLLKQQVALVGRDNWGLVLDARKLAAEWDRAAKGHADTAKDLRLAAAGLDAPENKAVLVAEAEAHERQARDVPRRRAACAEFLAALERNAKFFAETERTLDIAAASMAVNAAGGVPLLENDRAEVTDRQLQAFLQLLEKFAAELKARDPVLEARAAAEAARRQLERDKAETERVENERQFLLSPAGRRKRLADKVGAVSPPLHSHATHIDRTSVFPWYVCGDCGKKHSRADVPGSLYALGDAKGRYGHFAQLLTATADELARRRALAALGARLEDPAWAPTEAEVGP